MICAAMLHYCCLFGSTFATPERRCGLGFRGARTEASGSGGSDNHPTRELAEFPEPRRQSALVAKSIQSLPQLETSLKFSQLCQQWRRSLVNALASEGVATGINNRDLAPRSPRSVSCWDAPNRAYTFNPDAPPLCPAFGSLGVRQRPSVGLSVLNLGGYLVFR